MTARILYLSDHAKPADHGCLGPNCPLCRKPRALTEIISVRAAREAKLPRTELPADCEPKGAA